MSSKLNIVPELMFEKNELLRMGKFTTEDIYNNLKNGSDSFGVIRNRIADSPFNNFKVTSGTNVGTIALPVKSYAIDKDGLMITQELFDNVDIPDNGITYHVVISHQYSRLEVGLVNISADGILTGSGSLFTEVLRGQPHFPTKIKFYGSAVNTGEYQVVEVGNNVNAILAGQFVAETDLRYSVIGTFSPTSVIPVDDREIYRYDSCLFRIIDDTAFLAMTLIEGKEFKICTVVNNSGVIEINDYRNNIYISLDKSFIDAKAGMLNTDGDVIPNPLIGVESIKWDNAFSTKDKNEVIIAWGFRCSNWVVEPSLRKITFTDGEGGKYKTSAQFVTGDFNGWRLYNKRGDYKIITTSVKSSTSINLIVESLSAADYEAGEELFVCPDVEEVIIHTNYDLDEDETPVPQVQNSYAFPVNSKIGKIYLLVPSDSTYLYNIQYRYKRFNRYSELSLLPEDLIGFYNESSYTNGTLNANPVDRTRVPYTPIDEGYIILTPNPAAYNALISSVITGDLFGLEYKELSNGTPQVNLYVGTDKGYQVFSGTTLTLTADLFIILNSTKFDMSALANGNRFILHLLQFINPSTFNIRIVQDFVDPTDYTLIRLLNNDDYKFLRVSNRGIKWEVVFDGANWVIDSQNESKYLQRYYQLAETAVFPSVQVNPVSAVYAGYSSIASRTASLSECCIEANMQLTFNMGEAHAVSTKLWVEFYLDINGSAVSNSTRGKTYWFGDDNGGIDQTDSLMLLWKIPTLLKTDVLTVMYRMYNDNGHGHAASAVNYINSFKITGNAYNHNL